MSEKNNSRKENESKKIKRGVSIKESNEKNMRNWKLVPPDGGWGWLVLFGATLVNILIPGTVKSFGVLFVEFLEVFDAGPSAAAWIPALCYFLYSSLGPLSSILSLKYSYRTVTLIGGTSSALGMIISFYADSVNYLYISYGILVGTGAGLAFPPTVYIVTNYFERLRGLANGICISGSAIGSIILPPLLRILLTNYGYRGAVLIMGGVTLNVWVAALFYEPVEKHMIKVPKNTDKIIEEDEEEEPEDHPLFRPTFQLSSDDQSGLNLTRNNSFADTTQDSFFRSPSTKERKISATSKGELTRVRSGAALRSNKNSSSGLSYLNSTSGLDAVPENEIQNKLLNVKRSRTPKRSPSTSSFQYVSTPYHGSTLTLQPEMIASTFSLKSAAKDEVKPKNKLFDITLLKDPVYLIILISNCTNAISYTNFIILLPSYALVLGFGKDSGALLLSIVSAFDLAGRIGGSALSDLPIIPKEAYFIGGLLISGISLALLPLASDIKVIWGICGIFGLASGIYVGVTAVIMADLLGTERIQSSYGISLFVNGLIQLVGPPLCGLWIEKTNSYSSLFSSLGVVLIIGASIWGLLPFVKRDNRDTNQEETTTEC
ncbi:monocarboxylate transporter 12 isoform X1 [Onthophagus taurus]|uniref:monocarboxylate transporter 12 isoform X1 n=2 Tax=Onthophagus taurus TaxID=166361 RepID=UPI0039BE820B